MREKVNTPLLIVKASFPVFLLALVMTLHGCSYTQPRSAGKPLTLKINKTAPRPPASKSSDEDDIVEYYGPTQLYRNLPLAGTRWEWEGDVKPQGIDGLADSSVYSVEFNSNGWFDIQADCRRGSGIYEANGEHIALTVIKLSHSSCRHTSQADAFLSALETARTYRLNDSQLLFDIKHQTEIMVFHRKP